MDTGTPSESAPPENAPTDAEDEGPEPVTAFMATYPPYPTYVMEPTPPSLADAIIAGRDLRLQHKSAVPKPIETPPMPAKPRGPKATDVKMSKREVRAHARCLRRHGIILTDRLERMSKPLRRKIIYMWRENAHNLSPETIDRFRSMLDADEPFKPDQAYKYFINLKKSKKKTKEVKQVNEIKKDVLAMVGEKRFIWARNATVAFARGIQLRLSKPGKFALADGMARLSDIILDEICGYMHMRTPSRRSTNPKATFMMEMSDKVAVWIDEILSESDDRMLMMDFDEDEEVERFFEDESRPEGEPPGTNEDGTVTPGAATPAVSPTSESQATPGSAEATAGSPPATPGSPSATPGSPSATPGSPTSSSQTGAHPPAASPENTPLVTPGETPAETTPKSSGTEVQKP